MLIGLSYSRCLLDIVEEKVDRHDVLVIITRTKFDPQNDEDWELIWEGYTDNLNLLTSPIWNMYDSSNKEHEEKFRKLTIDLYKLGKIHQPRQYGGHSPRFDYHWLETIVPVENLDNKPALKKAWEQYQILAGLNSN